MTSDQLEREIKFDASADTVLPSLREMAADGALEEATVRLDSVYFDTEDLDLLSRGITLRCRTGDADTGWQLKVPTGDARTEIRLDPTGSQTTVPKELATLVTGVRRGKALRHIVTVRTDRTVQRIMDGHGELMVEVANDRVDAVDPGRRASHTEQLAGDRGRTRTGRHRGHPGRGCRGSLGCRSSPVDQSEQGRDRTRYRRGEQRRVERPETDCR